MIIVIPYISLFCLASGCLIVLFWLELSIRSQLAVEVDKTCSHR